MAYGLQFFFETKSFHGKTLRLELLRKGFTDTPKRIINGSGDPVNVRWEGTSSDNPYYPIWGSSLTFNFFEQNGIGLEQIATDFERDVRIDFYVNGSLFWRGWVMPDLCNDIANQDNAQISIIATDGLGALSRIPLLTSDMDKVLLAEAIGTNISDWNWNRTGLISKLPNYNYNASIKTILEVLKVCIDKAELGIGLQVINDLYPTDLVTKDDRQLEYILVDVLAYQKDGESKTCEDVLKSILSTFGCVLFQRDGFWFIERINYTEGLYVQTEVYDKDFKFLLKKTDNVRTYLRPTQDNDSNVWWFKSEGFIRRLRPPYQYQTIEYEYSEPLNGCPDSLLWSSDLLISQTDWKEKLTTVTKFHDPKTGENYIKITDPIVTKFTGFESPNIPVIKGQTITISFEVNCEKCAVFASIQDRNWKFGEKSFWITFKSGDTNFSAWSDAPSQISDKNVLKQIDGLIEDAKDSNGFTILEGQKVSQWTTIELKLPILEQDGGLKITLKGGNSLNYKNGKQGDQVINEPFVKYRNFKVVTDIIKETHSFDIPKTVSFQAENLIVLNGDSLLGLTDKSTFLFEKSIPSTEPFTSDVTKLVGTSKWNDSSEQESDTVLGFTARSILNQYSTRHNIIEGTNRTAQNLKIGSILSFDSFKKFAYQRLLVCPPLIYDARQDTYNLSLFQLSCNIAKGRLSQYWSDSDGTPIYKNVFDYVGSECNPTFELETVCVEQNFILETVC